MGGITKSILPEHYVVETLETNRQEPNLTDSTRGLATANAGASERGKVALRDTK